MKLFGSTKKHVDQDKDGEDIPKLEYVEAVLVHCNLVNNNYQQLSTVLLTFVPNKEFGQWISIAPRSFTMLNKKLRIFIHWSMAHCPKIVSDMKLKIMLIDSNNMTQHNENIKNILKVTSFCYLQENLVISMVKKIMDIATKTEIDAKNASKRAVQKIIEATEDLMGHNIGDRITLVAITKSKEKEDETNKRQEIYILPKRKQQKKDDYNLSFRPYIKMKCQKITKQLDATRHLIMCLDLLFENG